MTKKPMTMGRLRSAISRARGIPIETNLARYRRRDPKLAEVVEACRGALGLEPYEEQLIAAAVLRQGKVAQMQTGEGKTLSAALAAGAGAADGRGFHIVTANDYLARRDAEWMRPLYEGLGLRVAAIEAGSSPEERRAAYGADVTYLTARELGFDYLRDGLAACAEELVQRPLARAIVDEADFILIDEARIPLVIAGSGEVDGVDPYEIDRAVLDFVAGTDFRADREGRTVALEDRGRAKAEALLGSAPGDLPERAMARIFASLHARALLWRDEDYIVKDGAVQLVDRLTGRVAEKRRWPWGIQAALEAKEGLRISPEGRIYGSIAIQHLMTLYPSLAAMTATAVPAAEELAQVYGLGTVVIPPHRASRRVDLPDAVFVDRSSRLRAVIGEIAAANARGRPVLVGTESVRDSEELSRALAREGIGHSLLNAKRDREEAALIARAGELGSVTISTNMAGRGTDIKLGEAGPLRELGGLYVIGMDKGDSRRVDDQLRGRTGRQGDPGTSRFFISLEDPLFARYGVRDFLPRPYRAGAEPGTVSGAVADPACLREIGRAQRIIEGQNSRIRRALLKRSLIVEYDRRYLRGLRDEALLELRLPPGVEEAVAARLSGGRLAKRGQGIRRLACRAFIARLDAMWADHLGLVEDVKEGLALQRLGGCDPSREYLRMVAEAFESAVRELEEATIRDVEEALARDGETENPLALGEGGRPDRPSSTWTYTVDDEALPGFDFGECSGAAALALGPLALPLFLARQVADTFGRLRDRRG
jgi:preprotein translocase subunit SecA